MNLAALQSLGWTPFFERQLDVEAMVARVGAHFGGRLLLLSVVGEIDLPIQLGGIGRDIAVGDWLVLEPASPADDPGQVDDWRIVRRLDRQSELSRKAAGTGVERQLIAANVDTLFIVTSCNQDFNLSRLERYLALAFESGTVPVVVLTKADLCEDPQELKRQAALLHAGLIVETVDARDRSQVAGLAEWCGLGKTVALLGSSGVGKSTLLNSLGVDRQQATAEIREDDDKGRHTTTARSLHRIPTGGWLLDTPGMRELQLAGCEDGLSELFDEVLAVAGKCKFRNCNHQGDRGCAVTAAVESGELDERRVRNFMKLQAEQARNAQSLMEKRDADRKMGRMFKSILADKRSTRDLR